MDKCYANLVGFCWPGLISLIISLLSGRIQCSVKTRLTSANEGMGSMLFCRSVVAK